MLIVGGRDGDGVVATAESYDPTDSAWRATGSMVTPREHHSATRLSDGRFLVAGGSTDGGLAGTAELYDPGG